MECLVIQDNDGKIILKELGDNSTEEFFLSTFEEHKQIWINNYLNKKIEEEINFIISEEQIDQETFQLVAYPVVHC